MSRLRFQSVGILGCFALVNCQSAPETVAGSDALVSQQRALQSTNRQAAASPQSETSQQSATGMYSACTDAQIASNKFGSEPASIRATIYEIPISHQCMPTCAQLANINNPAYPTQYWSVATPIDPNASVNQCITADKGSVWTAASASICCLSAPGPLNNNKDNRSGVGGSVPATPPPVPPTTLPAPLPPTTLPAPLPPTAPSYPLRTCTTPEDSWGFNANQQNNLFATVQYLKRNVCEPKCAQLVIWNANRPYVPENPPGTVPGMGMCASAFNGSSAQVWVNTCNARGGTLWNAPDCSYCCVFAPGALNDRRIFHPIGPEN